MPTRVSFARRPCALGTAKRAVTHRNTAAAYAAVTVTTRR
jgi:hypothetical protein